MSADYYNLRCISCSTDNMKMWKDLHVSDDGIVTVELATSCNECGDEKELILSGKLHHKAEVNNG